MFATLAAAVVLAVPPVGGRLDLGASLPLSSPQNRYFSAGFGGSATFEYEVLRWLDAEAQVGYVLLPKTLASPTTNNGTLLSLGVGARVRGTLDEHPLVPWGEVLVNYGASGGNRLPLTVSAGVSLRPVDSSGFLVGAFLRFQQVFALAQSQASLEVYDASLLSFGLSVEFLQSHDLADSDNDGLPDVRDRCPNEAGTAADEGCAPVDDSANDRDGDGVPDKVDRCPDTREDKDGFQDEDGCPDPDNDADGIVDAQDKCPNKAGPGSASGCPDQDGDGLPDGDDACPSAPGAKEDKGCPKYKEVVVTDSKIEIKQKIFFAFGLTKILPKSDPLLAEVAQALKDRSALCVRVEGHTDSQGGKQANLTLSDGRANAVRDALVNQGVATGRLTAKGYGDQLPIDNNSTLEGRENNRRVEFVIVPCGGAQETP